MTKETMLDLISQGEGVTIEFKECKNEVSAEVYPTVWPSITVDKPLINDLTEQEKIIYDHILKNGSITNSESCELLNIKSTRARDILKALMEKNIIAAVGENKNRKYVLS